MTTRKTILCALFVVAGLLCLASVTCAAETRIATVTGKGDKAVLVFADKPLKTMTETPFTIRLHDAAGVPIEDANLSISLTMPMMPMPPNYPQALWSDGAYRGVAVFTMAGVWQVHVELQRPAATTEKVVFNIEMVMMQ